VHFKKHRRFFLALIIFILLNIFFYVFLVSFHNKFTFNKSAYLNRSYHFVVDGRISGRGFNLITALGQYDSQWYLKIADKGYPRNFSTTKSLEDKYLMKGLSYAFFPLYPLILSIFTKLLGNIEFSAFILSQALLVINFTSLYFVVKRLYDEKIAFKASFLFLFFPFSIFYRGYYAESLYLLLLIWFSYFLIKRKFTRATFFLAFLNITKGIGFLLNLLLLWDFVKALRKKKISIKKAVFLLVLLLTPLLIWFLYNYLQTGNPLYFIEVRKRWLIATIPYIAYNFFTTIGFSFIKFDYLHHNLQDMFSILGIGLILLSSRVKEILGSRLWWVVLCIWLSPLLVQDSISFARFQSVSFPLFIALAIFLKGRKSYIFIQVVLLILYLIMGLYFINWYWVE